MQVMRRRFEYNGFLHWSEYEKVVLGYFMLRVLNGCHRKVMLKYMSVGHTKFIPIVYLDTLVKK